MMCNDVMKDDMMDKVSCDVMKDDDGYGMM